MKNNNKNDGGQAFPCDYTVVDPITQQDCRIQYHGMSLRDYFAIHATEADISYIKAEHIGVGLPVGEEKTRSEYRYIFADAMIKERNK